MSVGQSELKIDARRSRILQILHRDGQVRITQLAELLGATAVTIRNDLDALALDGYLERVHGGAVQTVSSYFNREFQRRKSENRQAKKHIAALASELIRDGNTIFLNSGTTTYYVALELKRRKNLQIVTNSLMVAQELGSVPTFRVTLLGGDINAQYGFTWGSDAQEQLMKYRADLAVLAMDGVCPRRGLSTYHAEEAAMNRLMMERSQETIVVASSSKLGLEGFTSVADISGMTRLVTDAGADRDTVARLRRQGISVLYK